MVRGTVEGTSLVLQWLRPRTPTARVLGQGLPDQGTRAHTLQLKKTWRRLVNSTEKKKGAVGLGEAWMCEAAACSLR